MEIPEDLKYTDEHEWVRTEGDVVRVGITDYAQDALGDIVFVQLPDANASLTAGDVFGEVESTKSVSDLFAPISGIVDAVNSDLEDSPELVNNDPYGDCWMIVIRPEIPTATDDLLDAAAYETILDEE